jgi:tetratricopeptide (TPR) repeat protein
MHRCMGCHTSSLLKLLLPVLFSIVLVVSVSASNSTIDRAAEESGIQTTTQRIQQNPKDANAYVRRAAHHLALQPNGYAVQLTHLRAAIADLETALKLEPNNFFARHNYGDIAYRTGADGLAVAEFTKAIELNPKSAASYMGRGWAKTALGKDAEAQKDFDQALKLNPSLRGKIQVELQNLRRQQADRRAAGQTLNTMRNMGHVWGGMPSGGSACDPASPQCKAFKSGDMDAANRFRMGNQTDADRQKYGH